MLVRLSIRDVVVIDRLDLELGDGLCALTGETGAGKSILIDALMLALGRRADTGLLRAGAARATVSAVFEIAPDHPAAALLVEHGLNGEETLVLRRTLDSARRSGAFVNDQPVTARFLADLGARLVEIHGQNDRLGLLDTATHRAALDAAGGFAELAAATAAAFECWREADAALDAAEGAAAAARRDEGALRAALSELDALAPEPGEAERLAERRALLREATRITEALEAARKALSGAYPVDDALRAAQRYLGEAAGHAAGRLDDLIAALDRAAIELSEVLRSLDAAARTLDLDPADLGRVEERLFGLREIARKHGVVVDDLAALRDTMAQRLAALESGDAALAEARAAAAKARHEFEAAARRLSDGRAKAATRLDAGVGAELDGLRMAGARFRTRLMPLECSAWNRDGAERVRFEVATVPGGAPGPIGRIASGGELSRFMLALRLVLAGGARTLVFDEIDNGIGGAVADAVGVRLARLGRAAQVLVVTHQPQIAARASHHYRVTKRVDGGGRAAAVEALSGHARREEVARMLAGAEITDEARAAADRLIAGAGRP